MPRARAVRRCDAALRRGRPGPAIWPVTIQVMKKYAFLTVLTLLTACASAPTARGPDAALNTLVEEYFDVQLELSPLNATAIGDTRYDDKLDETTSPGFREKELGIQRAFL